MDPMIQYLQDGMLPTDIKEAWKLRHQAPHYILFEDKLCKRSFSLHLLNCLDPTNVDYTLWEVHDGICRNHRGEIFGLQDTSLGFLLANITKRHNKPYTQVWSMPVECPHLVSTYHSPNTHWYILTLHIMRNGHPWVIPPSIRST